MLTSTYTMYIALMQGEGMDELVRGEVEDEAGLGVPKAVGGCRVDSAAASHHMRRAGDCCVVVDVVWIHAMWIHTPYPVA